MRRSLFTLLIILLSLPAGSQAAEEIFLPQCLVVKLPAMYYRTPLGIDPVEAHIIDEGYYRPHEGERIDFPDGGHSSWETAMADSAGWIQHPSLENGYAYFSYQSPRAQPMLLEGMGHDMVYVNGAPRAGNRYQYKDVWDSWEPRFDYSLIPIQLRAGRNDFVFLCGRSGKLKVKLHPVTIPVFFNANDLTLPDLIVGEPIDYQGAIVIVNTSEQPLRDLKIVATLADNPPCITAVPLIQPMSLRKTAFAIQGSARAIKGNVNIELGLKRGMAGGDPLLHVATIPMQTKSVDEPFKVTFISEIDGSVQYYAVNPARDRSKTKKALVLSVHGAGVEAINQAAAYAGKSWADIVAPTNRRPYGFNWEDWGRLDALEVLDHFMDARAVDSERVYLTGHSMGGHGVWILGALYPDRFAALGPSAGWLSFWSYRVREDMKNDSPMQRLMRRATLPSRTLELAPNYRGLGIYAIHGVDDDNVSVEQSRQMVARLEKFHRDFVYWEQPGAGHWWDLSDEPGADCVDWPPLFDFFARHLHPRSDRLRQVAFMTPNPGVTSRCDWLTIEAQIRPLMMSSANILLDPGKNRFTGTTENVARLSIDVNTWPLSPQCTVLLDSQKLENIVWLPQDAKIWFERSGGKWHSSGVPSPAGKGPHRYGAFKDAFRHRMIFVYGTRGSKAENDWAFAKARFDAEVFWYQGNGSAEVVADREFDAGKEVDRNVILYGNRDSNSAWNRLLADSPITVGNGFIKLAERKIAGSEYACLFIRPRPGSDIACVAAVAGSGVTGMRLTLNRPYLSPGYAFPDVTIYDRDAVQKGTDGITCAGYFGLDWGVETGEFVWKER